MAEMQREMEKMGIIDEMMQDAMEDMNDEEEMEDDIANIINGIEKDVITKNPALNLKPMNALP
eukprot:CAMPEP_0204821442 /NCGR_PEP_ID=MMETSP1018-20131115/19208_1 /ASSEMBLY_ACC=CAM_ASM_000518 /TAXON_ID=46462 /ORGANISM="Anophryoides haemophila, Strain AH6" /LENGTH=62 /DNA_ID=CAMNT_0051931429 /DNA_START=500 /DNA_END=688 /DNA_ORIENTATION=-